MNMTQPNVIWITIDSIRLDHTTLGGGSSNTTPNLRRVAQSSDGEQFTHCIAHSEWTRSSVASMLTGTYPENHMVGMKAGQAVPDSIYPIASRFSDQGYHTMCLSENPLIGSELNLTRGFDRSDRVNLDIRELLAMGREYPLILAKYLWNLNSNSIGFRYSPLHATGYITSQIAQRWMQDCQNEQRPFFMYLHFNAPHRPYYPPNSHVDTFADELNMSPEEAREFSLEVHHNLYEMIADGCNFTSDEWNALEAMYNGEICHVDQLVGELFGFVTDSLDDTIMVVTGDHGELFGEYGLLAHKVVLHDAIVRVPLVTSGLDSISHQSDECVQHIDLMKTILEHVGGDTAGIQGYNLKEEVREFAISQRGTMGYERDIERFKSYNESFDAEGFHDGILTAIRTTEEKLLASDSGRELVDLEDEYTDISAQRPDRRSALESALREWKKENIQQFEASPAEMTDELERHLDNLGYLA